jgi:hypothetical protein
VSLLARSADDGHWASTTRPRWTRGTSRLAPSSDRLRELDARIKLFINPPFEKLDGMALQQRLREIGGSTAEANKTAGTGQRHT